MPVRARIIVISGSMGSGKTTLLGEASDILASRGIAHAMIDLDAMAAVLLPDAISTELTYRNLASVWANYADAGVSRLLLAEAIEDRAALDRIRQAIPGADIVVCRLTASIETMQERVRLREPGMLREHFVARARALDILLDHARVEDFTVSNQARPVADVARELLARARWIETATTGK